MARKRKDKNPISRIVLAIGVAGSVLAVFGAGLWLGMQFGAEHVSVRNTVEKPQNRHTVTSTDMKPDFPIPATVKPKPVEPKSAEPKAADQKALDKPIVEEAKLVPEGGVKSGPARVPPAVSPSLPELPAWIRNAAAYRGESGKPMVALVIDDVGIDRRRSDAVVALPAPLTLSYLTYAQDLERQTAAARARGHELMVHMPMQPKSADVDPGPSVLQVEDTPAQLAKKLKWGLSRFSGYIGVNNHMGSRFTTDIAGMQAVMAALADRGLFFLDSVTAPDSVGVQTAGALGVPVLKRDVFLDNEDLPEEVLYRLEQVEKIALRTGEAIAIGHPHNATITVLRDWIPDAKNRGFDIVPISVLVRKRYPALWEQARRP